MPSNFDSMVAGMTPSFLRTFGETISVTSQVSGAKSIEAIVQRETRMVVSMGSADLDHDVMQIEAKSSFTDDVAYTAKEFGEDANSGDVFTIDGETWYLAEIMGRKAYDGLYKMTLKTKRIANPAE